MAQRDAWLAYQFDGAVSRLGRWVDGKLAQYDEQGNALHSLRGLLSDTPDEPDPNRYASVAGLFGPGE